MTIDFPASLPRIKPEKRRRQLTPRNRNELVAVSDARFDGPAAFVLDTNVYIRDVANTLPPAAITLLDSGLPFHCVVCIAELTTGIANADPAHKNWKATRDHYANLIATIPTARLLTPDAQIWAEAGLIAGTLARIQNFLKHQRKECLNDALIYLTAAKAGLPVLTSNRDEFDMIQQLSPGGGFIHF